VNLSGPKIIDESSRSKITDCGSRPFFRNPPRRYEVRTIGDWKVSIELQLLEETPDVARRALGFCVSQRHADFMTKFFNERGLRAVAVHSGPTSAPRAQSLERLTAGELDIVVAVDMFNGN
jgi:superfamily II DNA/RNA helicase